MATIPNTTGISQKSDTKVTVSTGAAYIDRHTTLLTAAFSEDPVFTYMLNGLPSREAQLAYLPTYMRTLLRASQLNDGIFVEADDWSSAAVWMPLGKTIDNPWTMYSAGMIGLLWNLGARGVWKMLVEFSAQADKLKAKFLVDAQTGKKLKRYHYLWFIGTDEKARGKGLASHLIARRQREVVDEGLGLPIWLEATTVKSRDVYVKCGFRQVGEVRLGVGTHASTGLPEKGGGGLGVYAMIWRPEWNEAEKDVDADAPTIGWAEE